MKDLNNIDFEKGGGLVPAIVQDTFSKEVLMLGYMNQEALTKTIEHHPHYGDIYITVNPRARRIIMRATNGKIEVTLPPQAGKSDLWYRYVGTQGTIIGIDHYGFSAPGDVVLSELGMNVPNIVEKAQAL